MPGDPRYAVAKLGDAIYELARGPGDVRSRLLTAYMCFHPVSQQDFPEHLTADFAWIMNELTKFESPYEWKGDVDHTLTKIRRKTGVRIAERIIRLESELSSYLTEQDCEQNGT